MLLPLLFLLLFVCCWGPNVQYYTMLLSSAHVGGQLHPLLQRLPGSPCVAQSGGSNSAQGLASLQLVLLALLMLLLPLLLVLLV